MSLADAQGYLALAARTRRNLELLAGASVSLEPQHSARDWLVTMHFYILVAYVNALAAARGRRLVDHPQRAEWIRSQPDLSGIIRQYRRVEDLSRDARYEGRSFDDRDFEELHEDFRSVRDAVLPLLRQAKVPNVPTLEPLMPT